MLVSRRYWSHLGFFLLSCDRSLPKRQHSVRTFYNIARKSPTPGYCYRRCGDPWTDEGAESFVPRPQRERGRGARGLHAARAPTPPALECCSRRGLSTLWLSPRARCRPGFLTLRRRRTPAPLWAPAAPSPLGAPAPFKPPSQPRAALPPRPLALTESCRRRPRPSARGRGQSGLLASHETKKPPPTSEGKPRARDRLGRPPPPRCTPPASPLRAHSPAPLPPQTASWASAARPASCTRPPALPLPARVSVGPGPREVGRARESKRARRASHL